MSRASAPARADAKTGVEMLRWMTLARRLGERLERDAAVGRDEAALPEAALREAAFRQAAQNDAASTGRGLEAISVGACMNARSTDLVAPAPGDLGAFLLRGVSPERIIAHYLGRAAGPARGRDGGGRIGDLAHGLIAPVTRAASSVAVAAGAGLAMKREGRGRLVLCLFHERAAWRGDWHEGMNFAAVQKLPVVFVGVSEVPERENAVSVAPARAPVSDASPSHGLRLSERVLAYAIPAAIVDGRDTLDVHEAVADAAARARRGEGPSLVEARIDPSGADRDPLACLARDLVRAGHATEDELVGVEFTAGKVLDEAFAKLAGTGFPDADECLHGVTRESVR